MESVAKSNLQKAIVYLDGAHLSFKNQNYDSASALAILAAIKAKDALAVFAAGKSKKAQESPRGRERTSLASQNSKRGNKGL